MLNVIRSAAATNAILVLIAALIATVSWQLHDQRPVTRAELQKLAAGADDDALAKRVMQMPLVKVYDTVDVEVQNSTLDVQVQNTTLSVEIDR